MGYAVYEKSRIKFYGVLPKSYHSKIANVLGGFDELSNEELAKHGFYPVEEANITDELFEIRGDLYFDETSKTFKYKVVEREQPSVEYLKKRNIENIETQKASLLEETNDIVLESLELKNDIPSDILSKRTNIRQQAESLKTEINNLNNKRDLLTFDKKITA